MIVFVILWLLPAQVKWSDASKEPIRSNIEVIVHARTHDQVEPTLAYLKRLGNLPHTQSVLAELYGEANDQAQRVAILRVLTSVGVDEALNALPIIAHDFATAHKTSPNEMSAVLLVVVDKFRDLAWQRLAPASPQLEASKEKETGLGRPDTEPTWTSEDGTVHTGRRSDRMEILQVIIRQQLTTGYYVPTAKETSWIRIIGNYAFVRLTRESSRCEYLFVLTEDRGWSLLVPLGCGTP